ncbi:MAG: phosphoribosylglycinamide formyltransferase [Bacteroidota bacterium]
MMQKKNKKVKVAVFASGNGSNAENLIQYFRNHEHIAIALIVSNNSEAYVLKRAQNNKIPHVVIPKVLWKDKDFTYGVLQKYDIDFIVLAGFLLLLPDWLVKKYDQRIINIHPSLLPAYGGKGMYGQNVHRAVIAAGEKKSGITIQFINAEYDKGDIIFQQSCPVNEDDTPERLEEKIHELEHKHFPVITEKVIREVFQLPKT